MSTQQLAILKYTLLLYIFVPIARVHNNQYGSLHVLNSESYQFKDLKTIS